MKLEELTISGMPRTPLGGVKAEAVEELLKHAAWEYWEAVARHEQLVQDAEKLQARTDELMARVASLEAAAGEHREPDELARALLASTQRLAREQRESARRDGELLLKKVRRRAQAIEDEARRRADGGSSELAQLQAVRAELAGAIRTMLETIVALGGESELPASGAGEAPTGERELSGLR